MDAHKKLYIAVIGDIVESKKISNRKEIQDNLADVLNQINADYADSLAANFMITLGDEFQGLLTNGQNVMDIVQRIEFSMHPVKMRFGLGIGEITTGINRELPLGADGPAYYNARTMIAALKDMEKKRKTASSNIRILSVSNIDEQYAFNLIRSETKTFSYDSFVNDALLNAVFSLCAVLKNRWTERQREIICDYVFHERDQSLSAERLGITQGSVQKGLAVSGYYSYKSAVDAVKKELSKIGETEGV